MSNPELATILEDLAAGRISSTDAAARIDALQGGRPQFATHTTDRIEPPVETPPVEEESPTEPSDPFDPVIDEPGQWQTWQGEGPARGTANGVEKVAVRVVGRRVRVIGDQKVATVSVSGPNVVRRNGPVIEITSDGELGPSFDGFSFLRPPRNLDDVRSLGLGKELVVRMNPVLLLDAEVTAGSLGTERVPHLGDIRVTAGGAKLVDVAEVADLLVQAGQATVKGVLRSGRSRVKAESGTLVVQLEDGSDVTVHTDVQLGKVSWAGGHTGAGDEVVMGHGNARLDVGVVMGHASVRVGSHGRDEDR